MLKIIHDFGWGRKGLRGVHADIHRLLPSADGFRLLYLSRLLAGSCLINEWVADVINSSDVSADVS
jgi:hypothetical protein